MLLWEIFAMFLLPLISLDMFPKYDWSNGAAWGSLIDWIEINFSMLYCLLEHFFHFIFHFQFILFPLCCSKLFGRYLWFGLVLCHITEFQKLGCIKTCVKFSTFEFRFGSMVFVSHFINKHFRKFENFVWQFNRFTTKSNIHLMSIFLFLSNCYAFQFKQLIYI